MFTELKRRVAGFDVLVALVASSALAYVWPWFADGFDPFRLDSTWLLGLVSLTMFCLGLVVQREELVELRRRPWMVLCGVVVQCTLMPALAWLVVQLLGLEGPIALGVLLAGCVPGAMASNVLTMTARGNVSYSVSLTSVATLLSPLSVPLALTVVAGLQTGSEVVDAKRMAATLFGSVVAPIVIGYGVKQSLAWVQPLASKVAPKVATFALLWIIASVVAANRDRLAGVQASLLVGLLLMNVLGYCGGYLAGCACRMPSAMRRALTLEVGMQNAGLGTALAASLWGGESQAQIPTAAYTFGCMLTGTVLAALWAGRSERTPPAN
ncbi:bile acid:sodium symporter family protein [Roseiconus nitratireducens]|uniref:Bile acid:sodium symporter family protein n=1 Tax=Roseiconus nitratireducens TaxID=2605748 RepID=A0A5M6DDH5_9BACT|nr:bile acid:sodium symporter family protein [Roseiconus nitratireducens]KAA5544516.1 bile acid:sodium symporter family protein [Roseiconus nitratireducens]